MAGVDLVVSEFAESLGLDDGLDGEGKLVLLIEERWLVTLAVDQDRSDLVVFAKISDEAPRSAESLRSLLKANFLWRATNGATLAMEPESEALVLHRRLESETLTTAQLRADVEDVLRAVQTWQTIVAGEMAGGGEGLEIPSANEQDIDLSTAVRV